MEQNYDQRQHENYLNKCVASNEPACLLIAGNPPTLAEGIIATINRDSQSMTLNSGLELKWESILGFPEEGL